MKTLKLINADGISSNTDMPESIIETVLRQGYQWHVWTVDDPETAKQMKALGAASITTNRPRVIREHLVEQSPAGDVQKKVLLLGPIHVLRVDVPAAPVAIIATDEGRGKWSSAVSLFAKGISL